MNLTEALRVALDESLRSDSVDEIHRIVTSELQSLDPELQVQATDYFNHSYVPDLVLRWGSNGRQQERHLYLRYRVSGVSFEEDLRLLHSRSPVFLGMVDEDDRVQQPPASEFNGTLISKSEALERLVRAKEEDERGAWAARQIIRAGHGAIDGAIADRIGECYLRALRQIEGVAKDEQVGGAIAEALEVLRDFVDEAGRSGAERELQTEWIRRGRSLRSFPGSSPWHLEDDDAVRRALQAALGGP